MNILLTGGLGFIGSHVACELGNKKDQKVVIIDNLYNSKKETYHSILSLVKYPKNFTFIEGNILDIDVLDNIFKQFNINSVIHFASLKAVSESVAYPLMYYEENLNGLLTILKTMEKNDCYKIIFSSSATVYGNDSPSPLKETDKIGIAITNPYGQTKYFQEQILQDFSKVHPDFEVTILRYFNPVGAHPSGKIGEDPNGKPNNLFPYILRVATKEYPILNIFGNDYDTKDGSGVRDFIHVMDLANGHVCALQNINKGITVYNLGTGQGVSVLEMVETFKRVNNCSIPYTILERREGDIATVFADVTKVKEEIGWEAKKTLEDICRDGYHFINATYKTTHL
jgi:UDP-glucose 4-epimerase